MFPTSFILVVWTFSLLCCVVVGTLQDTDYQMEDGAKMVRKTGVIDHTKCGNEKLDPGEECDCGKNCIKDPCCQSTCQFKLNAQCSNQDPCCGDNCKLLRKGSVCRAAENSCDIAEYCTGDRSDCPSNSHKRNGALCLLSRGMQEGICYGGSCLLFNQPCVDTMTSSERELTKCPVKSICVNNQCIKTAHLHSSCPTNGDGECSTHGDCSNQDVCVCHPGWAGADCSNKFEIINSQPTADEKDERPGRITANGPDQKDSTSDTIALAGGLVAFVLTVSIMFVCMACRFLPTRTPKDEIARYPPVQVETIDPDGTSDH